MSYPNISITNTIQRRECRLGGEREGKTNSVTDTRILHFYEHFVGQHIVQDDIFEHERCAFGWDDVGFGDNRGLL